MQNDTLYPSNLKITANHEAGHAVVWHIVGGLIEEVWIASSQTGYGGYCRFGFLVPLFESPSMGSLQLTIPFRK